MPLTLNSEYIFTNLIYSDQYYQTIWSCDYWRARHAELSLIGRLHDPKLNLLWGLTEVALQTQTALDFNTQNNFITHRPATSVPPSQSSTSEAELHPLRQRNPLSDQRPLGTKAHFSLESVLFIMEHVILPGHRKGRYLTLQHHRWA